MTHPNFVRVNLLLVALATIGLLVVLFAQTLAVGFDERTDPAIDGGLFILGACALVFAMGMLRDMASSTWGWVIYMAGGAIVTALFLAAGFILNATLPPFYHLAALLVSLGAWILFTLCFLRQSLKAWKWLSDAARLA